MFGTEKYMTTSPWIILAIILVFIVILSTVYGEQIKERLYSSQIFRTRYEGD
jgi:uncharacterized protein (DUF983 family)